MSNWKLVKLEEIATFQEGYVNPPQTNNEYFDGNIKWLRAVDLNDSEVWDTSRKLTDVGFESAGKSALMFKPNTIAISKSGTIGRLGILKDYMCGNRAVINIEVDEEKADLMYVFYSLIMARREIIQYAVGSVQANLYPSVLGKLKIPLPPLSTQKKIVSVLSAIDNLNINNQNIPSKNNDIIATLFRSWFIDFDPVKAKAEGKLPYGMDEETAALFPDSFEDSELGPIPTGWRLQYLADLCNIQRGFSYTGASLCEQSEGIAMINLASFVEGGGYKHTGLKHITSEFKEKFYIKRGDVFIATVDLTSGLRVVGSPLIAPSSLENESIFSQDLLRLRNKTGEKIGRGFLFHWLKIRRGILKQWSSGTTVSRFPISALNRYPVLIPPREILQHFENIFDHTQEFSDLSETKMARLSLTRDSLLPKLMSGELEVN